MVRAPIADSLASKQDSVGISQVENSGGGGMYILRIGDRFAYSGGLRDGIDHRLRVHLRRAFLRPVEQEFSRIGTSDSRRRVNLKVRARDRSGDCPHPCPDTACQISLTVDARFHHSVARTRLVGVLARRARLRRSSKAHALSRFLSAASWFSRFCSTSDRIAPRPCAVQLWHTCCRTSP